jgi:tRNA-dihydrouridine synthase B
MITPLSPRSNGDERDWSTRQVQIDKQETPLLTIGNHSIDSFAVLAPMAGVTDRPFRSLCRRYGAGLVVSEMVTSDTRLWHSEKSRRRLADSTEAEPRAVQIAGSEPTMMAEAARRQVDLGAQIIDINMGCPAKKVCRKAAGSALLADEKLVTNILEAVVAAVNVPVTLKIRTGSTPDSRNGITIARIAENCGVRSLAVHGRTRECKFRGAVEYDTIAAIVEAISIPVLANGDITTPQLARRVLEHTGAAAIMIGRGAQGRPWIFREINHYLQTGQTLLPPTRQELRNIITDHLTSLHTFYGDIAGVRIARKHLGWYLGNLPENRETALFRQSFNCLQSPAAQLEAIQHFFEQQPESDQDRAA